MGMDIKCPGDFDDIGQIDGLWPRWAESETAMNEAGTAAPWTAWSDTDLEADLLAAVSIDGPWETLERFSTLIGVKRSQNNGI